MLRSVLQIEDICRLLRYGNGHLDDTSDDLVDDSALYMALVALTEEEPPSMEEVLSAYKEPFPGARRRVEQVLEIMVLAYRAAVLKEQAIAYLGTLDVK